LILGLGLLERYTRAEDEPATSLESCDGEKVDRFEISPGQDFGSFRKN
jgi:hypothetical protein